MYFQQSKISILVLVLFFSKTLCKRESSVICDDDEAVMEIVLKASSKGEPIVEPKCMSHSPIQVDHCDGMFRPETKRSYLKKLSLKERIFTEKRIYKKCLSKENESRRVYKSSSRELQESKKHSNAKSTSFSKDYRYSCSENKTSQFVSVGSEWDGSKRSLKMKCQHVNCVWDCIDSSEILNMSAGSSKIISTEDIYTAKYNLTKYKDAFFANFEIVNVRDGDFVAKSRVCRDCSRIVPPVPVVVVPVADSSSALVISPPCPASYVVLESGCCLQYHSASVLFADARAGCQSRGADLAVVRDTYTFNYIADMVNTWTWVGHQSDGAPNYLNSDGSSFTKSQLESIAPNGIDNYVSQGCVEIRPSQRDFKVDDCSGWTYPYVCGINC